MRSQGAQEVRYLPKYSPAQTRFFNLVKALSSGPNLNLEHRLWEQTPFIDYPQVDEESATSAYDWRWEREWRVRGDLDIDDPSRVEFLLAPEQDHDAIRHMWFSELAGPDDGSTPPIVDARWSIDRKLESLRLGRTPIDDELNALDALHETDVIDTAAAPMTWFEDDAAGRREQLEEWSGWLDEMERDDI